MNPRVRVAVGYGSTSAELHLEAIEPFILWRRGCVLALTLIDFDDFVGRRAVEDSRNADVRHQISAAPRMSGEIRASLRQSRHAGTRTWLRCGYGTRYARVTRLWHEYK